MKRRKIPKAFHPGEYLRDELETRGWNEYNLRSCCPNSTLWEIRKVLCCRHSITPIMAKEIGKALETSAEVWLNLQKAYDIQEELKSARKR